MLQDSLDEKRNLDASCLNWPFSDAVNRRRRKNGRGNTELFICCKDSNVNISMYVIFNWEGRNFFQVGNVVVNLVGRLS